MHVYYIFVITGDNILTAISVAKECKMVNQSEKIVIITASMTPSGAYTLLYHHMDNQCCSNFVCQDTSAGK